MVRSRGKAPKPADQSVLVQSHVSKEAADTIAKLAEDGAISKSAVVRRLIYVGLGIIKEDKRHG